jgi:CubicO group peptidase (beta-lactamase class C family)
MTDVLTADGLERLHDVAQRHVGDDRVPGLVTLVARGEQVHVEALGTLSIGGTPVTRDSLFRIASTTKPVTAAGTLALADEGLIDIDEPVESSARSRSRAAAWARTSSPADRGGSARRCWTPARSAGTAGLARPGSLIRART